MPSIRELLAEASQISRSKKEPAGTATVPADSIHKFADSLINYKNGENVQIVKEAAQDIFFEKIADAVTTINSFHNIALAYTKDRLLKEAHISGKTESEIDELIEKIASSIKRKPLQDGVISSLGLLGVVPPNSGGDFGRAVNKNEDEPEIDVGVKDA